MYLQKQWDIARRIYGKKSWRETRRVVLYVLRSIRNKNEINALETYFTNYKPMTNMLDVQVGLYELMSRVFLYKGSTVEERLKAITSHFDKLEQLFTIQTIESMYKVEPDHLLDKIERFKRGIILWHDENLDMKAQLYFHAGQRKEGFLTLILALHNEGVYHANIRFFDMPNGKTALMIGTIQGYKEGLEKAKAVTKNMYGYRPKNFIVFLLQQLAKVLNIEEIYAVSDYGFYANTHLIRGHKAKIAELDSTWYEVGGVVCEDKRFIQLPLDEQRKPIEEIKSQKRNQYRKRYALLDFYSKQIQEQIKKYLK